SWGVCLPLYALRTGRDWGCGDLTDLTALLEWTQGLGGGVVGTLPMLAAFLDDPFERSPYSPVSRQFWNELYVDVERAPELTSSEEARTLLGSRGFRDDVERARRTRHVDYRLVASLKRRVLELLASVAEPVHDDAVIDYARFRAAVERVGPSWREWPAPARDGELTPGDVEPAAVRYHAYVHRRAGRQ